MFHLISYDIKKEEKKFVIQIFIHNSSDNSCDVNTIFEDSIFNQCRKTRTMTFGPKSTNWVSWDLSQDLDTASNEENGLQLRALWGANFKILINDEVVSEFPLKYTFTNLNLRHGLNNFSPFNKKKFWILGDSHSGYYTNTSTDYLKTSKYDIIPSGLMALTLHNFLNKDFDRWFNSLPIWNEDIVAIDVGEIDIRCGLFLFSIKNNIDVYSLTDNLLKKYFYFILNFKQKFKNELVILAPNRPIKDGYLQGNAEYFKLTISTINERIKLWNYFNNKLKLFCDDNSVKYWDIKHMYTDKDGSLFNEILYFNDIHIKVKEPMLFDLKHKIENNF